MEAVGRVVYVRYGEATNFLVLINDMLTLLFAVVAVGIITYIMIFLFKYCGRSSSADQQVCNNILCECCSGVIA